MGMDEHVGVWAVEGPHPEGVVWLRVKDKMLVLDIEQALEVVKALSAVVVPLVEPVPQVQGGQGGVGTAVIAEDEDPPAEEPHRGRKARRG